MTEEHDEVQEETQPEPLPKYIRQLKAGIWVYFLLIIFEGALRKWFLPGLATPLLVIRDPVAIWIIYKALKHRVFPSNIYISSFVILTIVAMLAAMAFGHGSLPVAIFGGRIHLIHFPLIFVIGKIMDHDDVVKIGKVIMVMSIGMVILIAMQFYSPQSAFVNLSVGGIKDNGFAGAGEYFRPTGTFSFTSGNVMFFQLVAAYLFYFLINPEKINRLILLGATVALLLSIPLSISRGLFFNVGIVVIFTVIAVMRKAKYIYKFIAFAIITLILLSFISQTAVFQQSMGAFTERFETANKAEGGVESMFVDRFLGGMMSALFQSTSLSFWGAGIGFGTNVGAMLLSGKTDFLLSEGEWGRMIGELGPLLGLLLVFIRSVLCFDMLFASFRQMRRGDMLAWMLLSTGFLLLLQGQWSQPTSLGFGILQGGLVVASFNPGRENL